jgi:hypothetical protein
MTKEEKSRAEFNRDTAKHEMTILHDDGLYRHLKCAAPGTYCGSFNITTWPFYLAYSGDMGEFMFTRIDDMFSFFRGNRVSPGYWSEKCVAVDKADGIDEFDIDTFRENVLYSAKLDIGLDDDDELPEDAKDELSVLLHAEDEWDAVSSIREFDSDRFNFTDFFENDCKQFSGRFLFACHAIQWAVGKYDEKTQLLNL